MEESKFARMLARHYLKRQIETKGMISRRKIIRFGPLISAGGFLFESGAVLGRAMRTKLEAFAYPFCGEEPDSQELAEYLREEGREIAKLSGDATTVQVLVLVTQMRRSDPGASLDNLGAWMLERGNREVELEQAMQKGYTFGVEGVGFGATFPERFEELYKNSYGKDDLGTRQRAVKAGLDIPPEPPEFVPLDARTEDDLTMFAEYCAEFYPDLVAKLELERFISRS